MSVHSMIASFGRPMSIRARLVARQHCCQAAERMEKHYVVIPSSPIFIMVPDNFSSAPTALRRFSAANPPKSLRGAA